MKNFLKSLNYSGGGANSKKLVMLSLGILLSCTNDHPDQTSSDVIQIESAKPVEINAYNQFNDIGQLASWIGQKDNKIFTKPEQVYEHLIKTYQLIPLDIQEGSLILLPFKEEEIMVPLFNQRAKLYRVNYKTSGTYINIGLTTSGYGIINEGDFQRLQDNYQGYGFSVEDVEQGAKANEGTHVLLYPYEGKHKSITLSNSENIIFSPSQVYEYISDLVMYYQNPKLFFTKLEELLIYGSNKNASYGLGEDFVLDVVLDAYGGGKNISGSKIEKIKHIMQSSGYSDPRDFCVALSMNQSAIRSIKNTCTKNFTMIKNRLDQL